VITKLKLDNFWVIFVVLHFLVMTRTTPLILLFFVPLLLNAQIFPKEESHLNFRLIGFSFPPEKGNAACTLEIAKGHFNNTDSFKKNIIKSINCKTNKIVAEVPAFGCDYTWCTVYTNKGKKTFSDLHHFAVTSIPEIDTNLRRLSIETAAKKYKDAYVFLDGFRELFDMKGTPIWYLPPVEGAFISPRDLKITPQGTLTFLFNGKAYETNLKGDILWKGPENGNGDRDNYHHELTRLNNGHYMVLGNERILLKLSSHDSSLLTLTAYKVIKGDDGNLYQEVEFGDVKEYDEHSNLVWSWGTEKYFESTDIFLCKNEQGLLDIDVHENAFYFDTATKSIYLSFRNISRILKIKYPEGNVLSSYGNTYKPGGGKELGNDLYCDQHCIRKSDSGYLYLFNNNDCNMPNPPKIIIAKEPEEPGNKLKKIWEYECNPMHAGVTKRAKIKPAGNVTELPDHSIFAQMSWGYSSVFIINRNKQILWSAYPEIWNPTEQKWDVLLYQYRASIITDPKQLEQMVWNAEM